MSTLINFITKRALIFLKEKSVLYLVVGTHKLITHMSVIAHERHCTYDYERHRTLIPLMCDHTCVIMDVDHDQILENTLKQQNRPFWCFAALGLAMVHMA